jgi:hypothetical protein
LQWHTLFFIYQGKHAALTRMIAAVAATRTKKHGIICPFFESFGF